MMRFDDLDVVVIAEHLRGFAERRNQNIDAQAGVGREKVGVRRAQTFDLCITVVSLNPVVAMTMGVAFFAAAPQIAQATLPDW